MGIKPSSNFGSKAVLKMLVAHPRTISIFPQFAQENIANLEKNPEFIAVGKALMVGFEFMVSNIGEPQVLRRVLANRPFEKYFVDYLSVPKRIRCRLARKRNDDEESKNKLFTLVT